jgi:hypothetical protein
MWNDLRYACEEGAECLCSTAPRVTEETEAILWYPDYSESVSKCVQDGKQ